MKDEKKKRLKLEQMEDSMGNGVNVIFITFTPPKRGSNSDETTTWRSGKQSRKEASKQQASKQSE
jgi:hypothetical protein